MVKKSKKKGLLLSFFFLKEPKKLFYNLNIYNFIKLSNPTVQEIGLESFLDYKPTQNQKYSTNGRSLLIGLN